MGNSALQHSDLVQCRVYRCCVQTQHHLAQEAAVIALEWSWEKVEVVGPGNVAAAVPPEHRQTKLVYQKLLTACRHLRQQPHSSGKHCNIVWISHVLLMGGTPYRLPLSAGTASASKA